MRNVKFTYTDYDDNQWQIKAKELEDPADEIGFKDWHLEVIRNGTIAHRSFLRKKEGEAPTLFDISIRWTNDITGLLNGMMKHAKKM